MKKYIPILALLVLLMSSCATKNNIYFQDRYDGEFEAGRYSQPFKLRPNDQISIFVKSRNQELAQLFNMGMSGYIDGNNGSSSSNLLSGGSQQNNYAAYTVDSLGEIDFPIIGKLKVGGKDRMEVAKLVTDTLRNSGQVDDAVVTVQYLNLYVNILGEMGPARQPITQDKYTIIDLLTQHDLTFTGGKRKKITIMRDSCGIIKAYNLDITNLRSVYDSPIYYVHPGDMVYAEPKKNKIFSATPNGNFFMSYSFWLSVPTLVLSLIAVLK